ncbi:unnamed protein product [Linum tenue]|uniref:DYW domain-containing protein n=1 Tax=Linum tenue TaxID=586396 RepID=A0AAV0I678_9ROSI|nr:unnamed protein product [Linum tenue]
MRIEPVPKVWGSLLGSSRVHCNVELAERARTTLFQLEPANAGTYVLLADTYAEAEDEKQRIVLGHSEKLALAFGLINTSNAEPIRITKHLWLCERLSLFTNFI